MSQFPSGVSVYLYVDGSAFTTIRRQVRGIEFLPAQSSLHERFLGQLRKHLTELQAKLLHRLARDAKTVISIGDKRPRL